MALQYAYGGAPEGPFGTGKTETTKDLGRAIGMMVYVFNCSEQMDYKSCGNIFKGLSQSGSWGCFDEFNRITVEVLSVIAVQVKCIQDGIRGKGKTFDFMGEIIPMTATVGYFITMNPGDLIHTIQYKNLDNQRIEILIFQGMLAEQSCLKISRSSSDLVLCVSLI